MKILQLMRVPYGKKQTRLEDREYQQDLSKLFTLLGNNLLEWWG